MREEKASALPLLLDVRRMDENNRAYAYRMLRKNIMTLQLQPGCQLSEAELCEQLAMSRTPVHEALMMLKSEWLVDVLPQRGSIVSKISVPYLNEGFAMRRILEPALLRGLAGKLTREQLNEFQELLNRQSEDLYLDQDAADDFFISLDNDFHRLLYHDSGYDRIWEAMHNVTSHMDRVRYLDSALCRGNIASVQKEHEQIFGYLRDGLPLDVDVEACLSITLACTARISRRYWNGSRISLYRHKPKRAPAADPYKAMAGGAFLVQYGYGFTPGCGYQFTTAVFLMDFAPEMLLFLFKTRKNSSLCS